MEKDTESHRPARIGHFKRVLYQDAINSDIQNAHYEGSGTEEDPYVVTWLEHDPVNPMEFPTSKKWSITMLVAVATLVSILCQEAAAVRMNIEVLRADIKLQAVAFVSSAYSGGATELLAQFRVSQIVVILGVSLFVLGFAVGPLIWAPMSGTCGLLAHYRTLTSNFSLLTSMLQSCLAGSTCSSAHTWSSLLSTQVLQDPRT